MPESHPGQDPYETWTEKAKRKLNENPWVPIGCLATTGALVMSAVKMRQGQSKHMNYWLRARVVLQGLTLVALVGGAMSIREARQKRQELENSDGLSAEEEQKKELEKLRFESRLEEARLVTEQEEAMGLQGMKTVTGPTVNAAQRDEANRKKQAAAEAETFPTSAPVTDPAETTTSAVQKSSTWKFWSKKDGSD